MSRPATITRALERAASIAWVAGRDERARHIKALETQARESQEDHREKVAKYEAQSQRIQREIDMVIIQMQMKLMAAFCPGLPGATQPKEK